MLQVLRQRDGWSEGVEQLATVLVDSREDLNLKVKGFGERYVGRRAAMVIDVVGSPRRKWREQVLPMVERFEERFPDASLADLGEFGPGSGLGLGEERETTAQEVAAGLHRYCIDNGLDEEVGVLHWAQTVEPVRFMWRYDPYVGALKNVGSASFNYLRMRSGADAIKPDSRVRARLRSLAFRPLPGEGELVLMAEALATELGITRLELDQLLW
jgi:hypothetical protein